MSDLERAAMEAVAKSFAARWVEDSDPPHFKVAGKKVTVRVAAMKRSGARRGKVAKPRLRFDRVVVWLIEHLRAGLGELVPDGMTVVITVTAPIRVPSKTAAAVEEKVRSLLERGSAGRDYKGMVHENGVRIRILKSGFKRAPKLIGFVHNPGSDSLLLLNVTRELLTLLSIEAERRALRIAGDGWLVVTGAGSNSLLEAYRYVYSQMGMATGLKKIVAVFDDGRVGSLTD